MNEITPTMAALVAVWTEGRWRPGIGDPSVLGWVTVAGYLLAAGLCLWAGRRERAQAGTAGWVWFALAGVTLGLGLNKQLDLQTLFGRSAKSLVQAMGWIDYKRALQTWFILAVAASGVVASGALVWGTRRYGWRYLPSVLGVVFLVSFVVLRGSSFHDVDWFLSLPAIGTSMNVVLELAGIMLIGLNAAYRGWVSRARAARRPVAAGRAVERTRRGG